MRSKAAWRKLRAGGRDRPDEMTSQGELFRAVAVRHRHLAKFLRDVRRSQHGATWDAVALVRAVEELDVTPLDDELRLLRDELLRSLRPVATQARLELDQRIRALCSERDWTVDGQWPELYVERAVEVRFSRDSGRLSVGGDRLDTLWIDEIGREIGAKVATLIPKTFSAVDFLKRLARAYDSVASEGTTQAPILRVYRQFVLENQPRAFWTDARKRRFWELTSEQFRARLTRSLDDLRGQVSSDGRRIRLLPPVDPSDSIFLYQPAEQRFGWVGRIEFLTTPSEGVQR